MKIEQENNSFHLLCSFLQFQILNLVKTAGSLARPQTQSQYNLNHPELSWDGHNEFSHYITTMCKMGVMFKRLKLLQGCTAYRKKYWI